MQISKHKNPAHYMGRIAVSQLYLFALQVYYYHLPVFHVHNSQQPEICLQLFNDCLEGESLAN